MAKLNPPTRALLSDRYTTALYPGISAPFDRGRSSSFAKSISFMRRSPRNIVAMPRRRTAWPLGPLAQESARKVTFMGQEKKIKTGFVATPQIPPQPCAQRAPNQIRHASAWRNARPGTVRAATRARGSSLRNCTFWKEPSNHEFRVFVDEYFVDECLLTNFMMSFAKTEASGM